MRQITKRIEPWVVAKKVFLLRCENMGRNAAGKMRKLRDDVGTQVDGKLVEDAVATMSFVNLSVGREIEGDDPSSHYRKGVSSGWCNYLVPEQRL